MNISLDALQVLDAIDRKGSFAAAASSLHRVPSAVSYSVQKLEQDLGVALFEKQGRRAVPTNAGQLLIEQGRALLQAAEQLSLDTQQLATGWEPRLRIALDHSIPDRIVMNAVEALYAIQPRIEITIKTEVLGGTWEALLEGRVDLAIGAVDDAPSHKGIHHEPWLTMPFVFAAAADHPICQEPQPLSQESINRHRLVVIRDTSRNQAAISRGILSREQTLCVDSIEQKISAQRSGLGVGTLPLHRIQHHLDNGELRQLQVQQEMVQTPTRLAWMNSNKGQALHFLRNQLQMQPKGAVPL
jgi:DNA-binding transcriptional LysR family regulator